MVFQMTIITVLQFWASLPF